MVHTHRDLSCGIVQKKANESGLKRDRFGIFHAQKKAMNKVWLGIAAMSLILCGIVARLRAAVNIQVPLGYQDETGFHKGVKRGGREASWPPFW